MAAVAVLPAAVLAAQLQVTQQFEMLNICCMAGCCMAGAHHVAVDWAVLHLADTLPSAAA